MRAVLTAALAITALASSACGSDSGSVGPSSAAPAVSIATISGVGPVLVDGTGRVLYTPDQEAGGAITCVDDCLQYWVPLAAGSGRPPSPAGGPTLDVITRPDGTAQVATGGRPLYTFAADAAGVAGGDGVADAFGGHAFTWHVVMADGAVSTTPTPVTSPSAPGGGYGY